MDEGAGCGDAVNRYKIITKHYSWHGCTPVGTMLHLFTYCPSYNPIVINTMTKDDLGGRVHFCLQCRVHYEGKSGWKLKAGTRR